MSRQEWKAGRRGFAVSGWGLSLVLVFALLILLVLILALILLVLVPILIAIHEITSSLCFWRLLPQG